MNGAAVRAGRRLRRDARGVAMMEFALAAPIVLAVGGYGVELGNLALANLRVNQVALALADNASRIGVRDGNNAYQLREGDLNDVLQGARLIGGDRILAQVTTSAGLKITANGRITMSSLETIKQSYDSAPTQRIHWQRCIGLQKGTGYDSSYGTAKPSDGSADGIGYAGTAAPNGMGDPGAMVTAPSGGGVIFVEINYLYKPLFGSLYVAPRRLHYVASFIVRDNRDWKQIYNPVPPSGPSPVASTCDVYAA